MPERLPSVSPREPCRWQRRAACGRRGYTRKIGERADFARLYVNVHVVGPGYNISIRYDKFVVDAFRTTGTATTWEWGSTGTHGGDASYIVSILSQHLDRFLAAYLRVNESACRSVVAP